MERCFVDVFIFGGDDLDGEAISVQVLVDTFIMNKLFWTYFYEQYVMDNKIFSYIVSLNILNAFFIFSCLQL